MTHAPAIRLTFAPEGLIIDNFAGGGGASTGIEMVLGRSPDLAINHDPEALTMHAANHPETRHLWQAGRKEHPWPGMGRLEMGGNCEAGRHCPRECRGIPDMGPARG